MEAKKHYRYRIYTENVENGVENVQKFVNWYFEACTIIETHGVYKGVEENGLIIEIISEHKHDNRIAHICETINKRHSQECCMVTIEEVQTVFI